MRSSAILISLLSMSGICSGQAIPDPALDAEVGRGIDAALLNNYRAAESLFASVTREFPRSAAGPVLEAGILQQRLDDLDEPLPRDRFDSLLTLAEVRADLSNGAAHRVEGIFLSTARGMRAVEAADRGAWMAAVRNAVSSASIAEEVLAQDSLLCDAGLPLGSYLYWKSRKTEAFNWLPFLEDRRSEGITLLRRSATRGHYYRYAAMNALVWVLFDAGEITEAEIWARRGLDDYPDNRTFLSDLAVLQERSGKQHEAAELWGRIAASLALSAPSSKTAQFAARVNRVRCLIAAGEVLEARDETARARSLLLDPQAFSQTPKFLLKQKQLKSLGELSAARGGQTE